MNHAPTVGHWVTTWAASAQGAYPLGAAIAQPDLREAFQNPQAGAVNQAMRMIVRPARMAPQLRLRFSNVFGDRPLHLQNIHVALHLGGGALVPASVASPPAALSLSVPEGEARWTDAIDVPWVTRLQTDLWPVVELAVSWSVAGISGPMTWHAKAMATSYLSAPGEPDACLDRHAMRLPHTSTSWYFLDAMDAWLADNAHCLVAFGDSLTDGTATTLNGHDRWPDVLRRELAIAGRNDMLVVNAGIGGNQIAGPRQADTGSWRGGPSAVDRLERDVLSLSGVKTVVWLEGINDFSDNGRSSAAQVLEACQEAVARLRAAGIRVIGATVPSALGSTREGHGGVWQDEQRQLFNAALRNSKPFDALVDLDAVLTDPATGALRQPFNGDSTIGAPGDGVHPNRAGHARMAQAILNAVASS